MNYISFPIRSNIKIVYQHVECYEYRPQATDTLTELVAYKSGLTHKDAGKPDTLLR